MNYKAEVNGREAEVKACKVLERPYNSTALMEYVLIDIDEEPTEVSVSSKTEIRSVEIRPKSAGIAHRIENNKIIIKLDKPAKFSIEINGSYKNNLCVFAHRNEYKEFIADENTMVFGKGIHNTDTVVIDKDGTTVYIEDGAIINGNIIVKDCRDITICGYGMICMEKYTYEMRRYIKRSLDIVNCQNVRIKDITINDSNDWSLRLNGCDGVEIDNVKIFGCRGNSDGVDVCGSRNVVVSDVFTRVWDDSFVVKGFDTGDTENVLFKDSVLWNDFARPMEVGVELRADHVRNIRFENIDIIHSTTGYPLMGIHHGDHAKVSDIVFDNIRIEETPGAQLFDIRITNSVWNRDDTMGNIENIVFSNIKYMGNGENMTLLSKSRLEGYSAESDVRDVKFHNIVIGDKAVKNKDELGIEIRSFVENVAVTADLPLPEAIIVNTEVKLTQEFELMCDGMYHGRVALRMENRNKTKACGTAYLALSPKNNASENRIEFELNPGETCEREYEYVLQPGKYVFFTKGTDNVENSWRYIMLPLPLFLNKAAGGCAEYRAVNYYGDDEIGVRLGADDEGIIISAASDREDETDAIVYTALPVDERDGEVIFSSEEVDFGEVCAVLKSGGEHIAAPQLRCPAEITYVFKNEPKIEKLYKNQISLKNGTAVKLPYESLGIPEGVKSFIIEIEFKTQSTKGYRYPYTLFRSVAPESTSHMFARAELMEVE